MIIPMKDNLFISFTESKFELIVNHSCHNCAKILNLCNEINNDNFTVLSNQNDDAELYKDYLSYIRELPALIIDGEKVVYKEALIIEILTKFKEKDFDPIYVSNSELINL